MRARLWIALALGGSTAAAAALWGTDVGSSGTQVAASSNRTSISATATVSSGTAMAASTSAVSTPGFGFLAPASYPVGANANGDAVAIGDVTGDGRNDVVVTTDGYGYGEFNPDENQVFVFAQRTDGVLSAPVRYAYGSKANETGLALGDLNHDAILDIVVGHDSGITLLISDGNGGFRTEIRTGDKAINDVGIVDIDLDGNLDVIAQSWYLGAIQYFGDGQGSVRATRSLATPAVGYNDLKIGDVTGDGLPDLVISSGQNRNFWVYPHNGVDGYTWYRTYTVPAVTFAPGGVAIGDFNGDGRNDIALSEPGNKPTHMWVYPQGTNGQLQEVVALDSYDIPEAVISADLDRDGRQDLVTLHGGWMNLGYYLQGEGGVLASEKLAPVPPASHYNTQGLAAGDVNGDGCTDVAIADYISDLTVLIGQNCHEPSPRPVADDIDGDRKSDLLWRSSPAHYWAYWTMDGAQRTGGMSFAVGPDWRVIATGDFHGDGLLDLVWTNGYFMQLWEGNGVGYTGAAMPLYPAGWRIVASGDVDGDGKADLTWRNGTDSDLAVWKMAGATVAGSAGFAVSPAWSVLGSGDLDGDHRMDLVMTDGSRMRLWSGTAGLGFTQAAMGGYPVGWELAGLGDIDGDNRSDLFWRQAEGGYFVYWTMIGTQKVNGATFRVDGSWHVVSSGDYDGDGLGDIVWSNGSSMQLWSFNGQSFAGYEMPGYPKTWSVIP